MFKRIIACLLIILFYAWSVYLMDHFFKEPKVIETEKVITQHTRTPTPIQECYFTADEQYMICKLEKK